MWPARLEERRLRSNLWNQGCLRPVAWAMALTLNSTAAKVHERDHASSMDGSALFVLRSPTIGHRCDGSPVVCTELNKDIVVLKLGCSTTVVATVVSNDFAIENQSYIAVLVLWLGIEYYYPDHHKHV